MDSCQIFNFLFGTRKATSELRKCFTSGVNEANSSSSSPSSSSSTLPTKSTKLARKSTRTESQARRQDGDRSRQKPVPPPSPLKQIQLKIVNFASGATGSSTTIKSSSNKSHNHQHHNVDRPPEVVTTSTRPDCDELKCGTYKATLVELPMEFDDDEAIDAHVDINNNDNSTNTNNRSGEIADDQSTPLGLAAGEGRREEGEEEDKWDREIGQQNQDTTISSNGNKSSQSSRGVILYDNPCEFLDDDQLNIEQSTTTVEHLDYNESFLMHNNVHDHFQEAREIRDDETDPVLSDKGQTFIGQRQAPDDEGVGDKLCSSADKTSERVRHLVRSFESFDSTTSINSFASHQPKSPPPPPQQLHQRDGYVRADQPLPSANKPAAVNPQTPTRSIKLQWPPPSVPQEEAVGDTTISQQQQQQLVTAKLNSSLICNSNNNSITNNCIDLHSIQASKKPTTIVKPLPPKTPPKSNRVKCFNINKPISIEQLFQDEQFLKRHFFDKLEPLDRCSAAQVCRLWRNVLYSNQFYWKDLVGVIDCTQLRREHLVECIMNTLQSAKLKQQHSSHQPTNHISSSAGNGGNNNNQRLNTTGQQQNSLATINHNHNNNNNNANGMLIDVDSWDQDEIWRIQELCNRYTRGSSSINFSSRSLISSCQQQQQHQDTATCLTNGQQGANSDGAQQSTVGANCMANSKSSSIPSQISSTLSSISISSLLSPLSESSRVDSIREKLYTALDERGFDAICLSGATDDDIEELVCKTRPNGAQQRVLVGRLYNCPVTDKGLDLFVTTFNQIEELELTGCNEITNMVELKPLENLRRLIITDCINIADGLAQQLVEMFHQLDELVIQAYHLTDAFLEYTCLNNDTSRLRRLELPNCKEITNSSMLTIAKNFQNVETLSISGSTKISDDGIEILTEHGKNLRTLDLSWCNKITDVSLECIACDLSANLRELILDRNIHITDIGLGYLATMSQLNLLYIRWCPRVTDLGLESILTMRTLKRLSLAGLHQITARSLLCLVDTSGLEEVELTNCPAVNSDLMQFLRTKMPKCNIIF